MGNPPSLIAGIQVVGFRQQPVVVIDDYDFGFRPLRGFGVFSGETGAGCDTNEVGAGPSDFFSVTLTTFVS